MVSRRVIAATITIASVTIVFLITSHRNKLDRAKPPDWSLHKVLPVADVIDILYVSDDVEVKLTNLSNADNTEMLSQLKAVRQFHTFAPHLKPDLIFQVPMSSGKLNFSYAGRSSFPIYDYVSQTGELGADNDWCYVPPQFKAWLHTLKTKTSVKHFKVTHPLGVTIIGPITPTNTKK